MSIGREIDLESSRAVEEDRFKLLAAAINAPASLPPVPLKRAVQLEREGRLDVAAAAYAKLGHHVKAAQLARKLGARHLAAHLLEAGGHRYEAARLYDELADPARAFACLVRQKVHDPGYVDACLRAIEISVERRFYSGELEALVDVFASRAPRTPRETHALLGLSQLMADHGRGSLAVSALERILEANPQHSEALTRRVALAHVTPTPAPNLAGGVPTTTIRSTDGPTGPTLGGASGAPASLKEGTVMAGRYRLAEKLGRGGMGVVYKAHDLELQEDIAVKILTSADDDPASLARFKRESALARQLAHPNIVRVYDFGTGDGYRYITMELLVGETLGQRLKAGLSLVESCRFLRQACLGLHSAHEQGVVHRDVKPDNLFINQAGTLKVMDFGIAKVQRATNLTGDGSLMGTPRYMSPEQFSGGKIGPGSDIYSLGVVAYVMFTGTVPFDAPDLMPLMMLHTSAPPPAPRSRNAEVPEELERIVLRMLEKKADQRFADCNALRLALEDACRGFGEDITRG